ncbi:MAG TPA: tRNA pseudouridine(38-40) synthase TruA [Candidatus Lachnoclostridium stercoravium]|uniref:tRNA pseudouridine synthase A n=1 Tax=Candidatus Lachnoclostridium stercoravium TaxID=2838633 RepID=A0A9D2HHC4_9FIRM|nr:tRNA pseudouridine(38-40) synthase TruA [Candidatus Lachnoclostridium stercoravium]
MNHIKIVLQYDGSRYDGWQKQGNTGQTIQGKLEDVLEKLAGVPVEVRGAGRTDAGVHALGQTADFYIPDPISPPEVKSYLNRYLPEDIRILKAEQAGERFHSRLNAVSKTYRYVIETGEKKDVFQRKYVYGLGKRPDVEAMKQGASFLTGERDFKSFCANKKMKKSTVRTVYSIDIREEGSRIILTFRGNGFLYHMVRIMTGTLIEVGLGKRPPEDIKRILAAANREEAGFTAPAEGLFLVKVDY